MTLYIWLLWHQIAITCIAATGCVQTSMAHFDYMMGIGALELILEISGIIRIYVKKVNGNGDKSPNKEE